MKTKTSIARVGVGAAVAAACAIASPAMAAEPGFYMAGDFGSSKAKISRADIYDSWEIDPADFDTFSDSLDRKDNGFSFSLGYQFSPNFAVEAAYVDLGGLSYAAEATDGGEGYDVLQMADSKGPSLSLIGSWPVAEAFSLDATLGAYFGSTDWSDEFLVDDVSAFEESGSSSDVSMVLGVGATWSISERVGVRFSYSRFNNVDDIDVDRISIGLKFSF